MSGPSKPPEVIYFATLPYLPNLFSLTVTVPSSHQNKTLVSPYQAQIIKCRELIFTEPDIIATPLLNQVRKLQIILAKDMFKTGRLQSRLQKIGLQIQDPQDVSSADFRACLKYTMLAKLAPAWNKAGDILVHGREFVTNTMKMQAVSMDLNVTETEVYLAMRAHIIRAPPVSLNDLGINRSVCHQFLTDRTHGVVQEEFILNRWCHILPSMKRGKVVKVLHSIPADSPFKGYKDIKRYWKNTYGYRLPETDDGMLYYQIYFRPVGETLFTYPECCVRSRDIFCLPRVEQGPILDQFLQDMGSKVPSICGQKFVVNGRARYPQPALLDVRELSHMEAGSQEINLMSAITPLNRRPQAFPSMQQQLANRVQAQNTASEGTALFASQPPQPRPTEPPVSMTPSATASIPRFTPAFKPRFSSVRPSQNTSSSGTGTAPHVEPKKIPVFKPNKPQKADRSTPKPTSQSGFAQSMATTGMQAMNNTAQRSQIAPQPKEANVAPSVIHTKGLSEKTYPTFHQDIRKRQPVHKRSFDRGNQQFDQAITSQTREVLPFPSQAKLPSFPDDFDSGIESGSTPSWTPLSSQNSAAPWGSSTKNLTPGHCQASAKAYRLSSISRSPVESEEIYSQDFSTAQAPAAPSKRKLPVEKENSKTKKPRPKPKVQEGLDIEGMAVQNQLHKVNAVTLQQWLKERGLPCRGKDKKIDLIARIQQALNMCATV